jgi:sodium transport system permease protein
MIVYRKELLEMLRDRRTLFATLLLPVLLYPLLFVGFSSIMSRQADVLEKRGAIIALQDSVQNDVSRDIVENVRANQGYVINPYDSGTEQLYQQKDVQAILTIADSLTQSGLQTYKVTVRYDASKERNQLIYGNIKEAVSKSEKTFLSRELSSRNVDPGIMSMVKIIADDTSTAEKKVGSFLGMILPYLMILMLVTGASLVAADIVAGEKERHTLETLLVASAHRNELVLGKYLTIITVSMVNVVVNLFSMSISMQYMMGKEIAGTAVGMPVKGFLILLAAMVPLATLFAALLLSISTFSRNMKEARSYEQPVVTISMLLGMISFFPSVEINNLLALIPVVNIALLFKAVMINEYSLTHLLITVGSTLIFDVLAIWASIRLFNKESVLFRTDEERSLKAVKKDNRNLFNPFNGLIYYVVALLALYYIGGMLQKQDLMKGLLQTQVLIILVPVMLLLKLFKLKDNEILRIKAPRIKEVLLIPFIAVPAALMVAILTQLISIVFPIPPEHLKAMEGLFRMDDQLWKLILIVAVTPGFCEEILFRGFLMRFFEGQSKKWAVVVTALLFAVFHLDPFKMLPVFLLGLLLGYLTIRSGSIVNSMISHMVNNSLALLVFTYASSPLIKPFIKDTDTLHYWVAIPAAVIFVAALWAFHKITASKQEKICVE